MRYEDERKRLEENSVNQDNVQAVQRRMSYAKKSRKKSNHRKKVVVAILLALSLAAGSKYAFDTMHPYFDGSYVNHSYTVGYDSINSSTHRTSDNTGYWYDVDNIARLYDESDMDFDSYVYGSYCGMDTNRVDNMNDLFWQFKMRGITDYGKFTDYIKGFGCVKTVDGQEIADIDAWKDLMRKNIRVGNELLDIYSKIGTYNGMMDIDIYINRVYNEVGWNHDSKLVCMDELMQDLYSAGYTPYYSFLDYCDSKGFVKEKDDKKVVDEHAYEKGFEQYAKNLDEMERLQLEIDEFRGVGSDTKERDEGLGR